MKNLGQIEITFEYSRHLGPRFVHGGVTLSFDDLRPYGFTSKASWPPDENYEPAIRQAVEEVLLERQGHLNTTAVALERISWDTCASCEAGFRRAARIATECAFSV